MIKYLRNQKYSLNKIKSNNISESNMYIFKFKILSFMFRIFIRHYSTDKQQLKVYEVLHCCIIIVYIFYISLMWILGILYK